MAITPQLVNRLLTGPVDYLSVAGALKAQIFGGNV